MYVVVILIFLFFLSPRRPLGRDGNKFSAEAVVLCRKGPSVQGQGLVVDLAVFNQWLGSVIFELFSNVNDDCKEQGMTLTCLSALTSLLWYL